MPWTAEQKRAARQKRKAANLTKEDEIGAKMIQKSPPLKMIKTPYKEKDLGNSNIDYGGHQKALNFPMEEGIQQVLLVVAGKFLEEDRPYCLSEKVAPKAMENKIGSLSIGLVYEGDWKAKSHLAGKGQRTMCKVSEQYLAFLKLVKEMLLPRLHPTLQPIVDETLRVTILCGARTLAHTDSFRGNTPNALYILKQEGVTPGYLCYDTFPVFKYSLVKLFGKLFIPHSYSQASNECKCIGEHPFKPNQPYYYVFPANVIDMMEPYGEFDFGVIGWSSRGKLQVVPGYEDVCIYKKPLTFHEYTWQQVLGFSKPAYKKPRKRIQKLAKTNTWMLFKAYCYRHWWVGNHMTLRYHAFFRSIRETPTSSNIIRKGKTINYVDAKDLGSWKIHDRNTMQWSPIEAGISI